MFTYTGGWVGGWPIDLYVFTYTGGWVGGWVGTPHWNVRLSRHSHTRGHWPSSVWRDAFLPITSVLSEPPGDDCAGDRSHTRMVVSSEPLACGGKQEQRMVSMHRHVRCERFQAIQRWAYGELVTSLPSVSMARACTVNVCSSRLRWDCTTPPSTFHA